MGAGTGTTGDWHPLRQPSETGTLPSATQWVPVPDSAGQEHWDSDCWVQRRAGIGRNGQAECSPRGTEHHRADVGVGVDRSATQWVACPRFSAPEHWGQRPAWVQSACRDWTEMPGSGVPGTGTHFANRLRQGSLRSATQWVLPPIQRARGIGTATAGCRARAGIGRMVRQMQSPGMHPFANRLRQEASVCNAMGACPDQRATHWDRTCLGASAWPGLDGMVRQMAVPGDWHPSRRPLESSSTLGNAMVSCPRLARQEHWGQRPAWVQSASRDWTEWPGRWQSPGCTIAPTV